MNYIFLLLISILLITSGCGHVTEVSKTVWGSSTRALETSRDDAPTQSFACSFEKCYDEVLSFAQAEGYVVFQERKAEKLLVLMGVPKSVDTTEVGIFFTAVGPEETKLEVASLSSYAEEIVSDAFFSQLEKFYEVIE